MSAGQDQPWPVRGAGRPSVRAVYGTVRLCRCPQCGAAPGSPCSGRPPADCLARWLATFAAGHIAPADLAAAIRGLVVVAAAEVLPLSAFGKPGNMLLTHEEVAALLHVDPRTVARWARSGRLPSIRTPGGQRRYPESELRRFLSPGASR